MERLTEKCSAGYELVNMLADYCDVHCKLQSYATCRGCAIHIAFNQLGEYEDTNLTPKQINKLKIRHKEVQKENRRLKKEILEMSKYAWYEKRDSNE